MVTEIFGFGEDLVASNFFKLVSHWTGLIDPGLLRIDAEDEKVEERNYVISPRKTHLSEGISARKNDITFKRHISFKRYMGSIIIGVFLRNSKVDEVYSINQVTVFRIVSYHDVVGFDVAMYVPLIMEHFEKVHQFDGHRHHALEGKVLLVPL